MPVALVIIGFLGLIGTVLLLDDGLEFVVDTFEAIFHDVRFATKVVVNRVRRFGRAVFYIAIGLLITYALCLIALIGALIGHWTMAVIGLCIALTVIPAIFFVILNWITVVTKRAGPSVLATLTLIPLPLAFWAATTPFHFYEWLLAAYGLFMIVGFAFIILGRLIRSTVFLGPYAITGILVISGILTALIFAFPQQAREVVIDWKISNRDSGRDSLAKEISLRTEDKVTAKKVYWWKVTTDSSGKETASRYLDSSGKQCFSKEGDVFKTIRSSADSVEVGQTLVQAYFKDPETGEYMFIDQVSCDGTVKPWSEDELPWLAASGTTASTAVKNSGNTPGKTSDSETSSNSGSNCVVSYPSGSCWTITPPNEKGPMSLPTDTNFTSSQVTISEGGKVCKIVVPADATQVFAKGFTIKSGEKYEVSVEGSVLFSNEHPRASASGLSGWRDPNVEGVHKDKVGGLEFGLGSFTGSQVVGNNYSAIAEKTAIPVVRVVETTRGRKDGNYGGYIVTITRL